ncbi:hypothetical protein [Bacteroides zoogleoformans]|nr:hypothetical protein [Bacteroides zoogleoformans]
MDNNPGTDAKLFSDTHPYVAHAYKGARKAVEKFMAERVKGEKAITCETKKDALKTATKKAYEWISENVPEKGYSLKATADPNTHRLNVSRGSLKDVVDHFKTPEDKMLISELISNMAKRVYTHSAALGEGKKGDPETIKKNLNKKRDRGVVGYNYYDVRIGGTLWELNCEVYKKGFEKPYALKHKKEN